MAKKAKGNRVQVILECTEHKDVQANPAILLYIVELLVKQVQIKGSLSSSL